MIFKNFQDKKISLLGMGCMRLPVIDGNDTKIDVPAVEQMVAYSMEKGVNYYDTAWGYHAGNSELVMGEVLAKYPRESFYLADKFPGYDTSNFGKTEEIFERQLEKCKVDYFDFYLFHNVCEANINEYLDSKFGTYDYLIEQKQNGRIRHLGFSIHGTLETMKRFLDAYGKDMEFCQVQLNWLDWNFQNAKAKIELLREWNIPVWVMEPVRGGSLIKLSEKHEAELKALQPDWEPIEWALRYLQSIEGVTVVLTGASHPEQTKQNISIFETEKKLSDTEIDALYSIAAEMTTKNTVPCTSCRYCTSHCPQELDIPRLLELYNEHSYSGGGFIAPMALGALEEDKKPSACIGCQSCEAVCPQQIKIAEVLADFSNKI